MGVEKAVSKAEFARRLGVSRSTVTRAAQAGRLVLDASGMVLLEQSTTSWAATAGGREDLRGRHQHKRGGKGVRAQTQAPLQSRSVYQAQRLEWENKTTRLDMRISAKELLPLPECTKQATTLALQLKQDMENLIDNASPRLAHCADAPAREQLLGELLRGGL